MRHFLLTLTAVALTAPAAMAISVSAGADWLVGQQDAAGWFPWTPGSTATYNTQGPSALGLVKAYQVTGTAAYLDAAEANANFLMTTPPATYTDGDHRFATHDPMFLEVLSQVSGTAAYADYTQVNFWDKLTAGTYGETNDLDALEYGHAVVDGRNNNGQVALTPWDLSKTAIGAYIAGETAITADLMDSILYGLESTTATDTDFDLIGLTGAVWASAVTGIDLDPTVGRWAAADSAADLAGILVNYINADGALIYDSTADMSDLTNADTQGTAFLLLALEALDATTYSSEIAGALAYMDDIQAANGQFLGWPGSASNYAGGVEVQGEVLYAIPEPASLSLLTILVALVIRRR